MYVDILKLFSTKKSSIEIKINNEDVTYLKYYNNVMCISSNSMQITCMV